MLQQIPFISGSVLAAPVDMDEQLFSLDLALTQRFVEGFDPQSSIHLSIERLADHAATEQTIHSAQRTEWSASARQRQPAFVRP